MTLTFVVSKKKIFFIVIIYGDADYTDYYTI